MPDNFQNLNHTKERIISIIESKGPSLPVQIARAISVSPMFSSVFLSELYNDSKLKMSNMKVGSSSLYYLKGQEQQLENFIEHLNQKEKEAFLLIKDKGVLEDEKQVPAIRVALRSIKDFAIPIKIKRDEKENLFWRYFLLSDEGVNQILQPPAAKPKPSPQQSLPKHEPKQEPAINPIKEIKEQIMIMPSALEPENQKPKERKAKPKEHLFPAKLKDYLKSREIILIQSLEEKSKEFTAKIQIDTLFGKQEFYLLAKDKKKLSDVDLTIALQKAQTEKMPSLVLATGELDKKAQEYIKDWRNLIKFEKLKLQ